MMEEDLKSRARRRYVVWGRHEIRTTRSQYGRRFDHGYWHREEGEGIGTGGRLHPYPAVDQSGGITQPRPLAADLLIRVVDTGRGSAYWGFQCAGPRFSMMIG